MNFRSFNLTPAPPESLWNSLFCSFKTYDHETKFFFLPHLHSLIVFFFILYLTPATAQKGINLKEINLKEGKMKIYLPDDIRSGETISGTVVLEPEGSTEKIKIEIKRLYKNMRLVILKLMEASNHFQHILLYWSTKIMQPFMSMMAINWFQIIAFPFKKRIIKYLLLYFLLMCLHNRHSEYMDHLMAILQIHSAG